MNTLYIRLPSRAAFDSVPDWLALPCPFALVGQGNAMVRQGAAPLSELSGTIASANNVVVLLAASDVTLLQVKAPPLSAARLKAALPGLVEDQLISDPTECVLVAGGVADGLRTVAVVQRAWLDKLAKMLVASGARRFAALPASVCLPCQPGSVAAAINEHEAGIDLTLRLSEQDGMGLAITAGQHDSAAQEVIRSLCAIVAEAPVALHVPQSSVWTYQDVANQTDTLNGRFSVHADSWPRWITGANSTTLNLMTGIDAGSRPMLDWRMWRWALALAVALLVINAAALNFDWWRMSREAGSLRASMTQIYKSAYPKETVIIDPVAQMQQKIAAAQRQSGQAAPDDFTAITAAFGEAWARSKPASGMTGPDSIAALEYRERSLHIRLRQANDALTQQMKTELAKFDMALETASDQADTVVWKIRSKQ